MDWIVLALNCSLTQGQNVMVTMVGPAVTCCYGEDCSQITGTEIIDIVPT